MNETLGTEVSVQPECLVIVGQGYVGLPIAMRAVEVGFQVQGFDIDDDKIARLSRAESYVEDVSDETLRFALDSDRYKPTSNLDESAGFDFAIITVPTPLRETLPDLTFIEEAAKELAPRVRPGAVVVLESTTYPGTTEQLMVPILEHGSGLTAGVDFHVGYSPERIDPGNQVFHFVNTPKVVSGINEASLKAVSALYERLVEVIVPVASPKEAELTKLLENTFRHVNIALVNELAVFAKDLGIDVWEAIDAASTKPFGYMKFTPGPGVGGHCLPVDPSYLSWQVKRTLGHNFRFVELANDVNDHMPDHVVRRIVLALNKRRKSVAGSRILLLGLAYKKNTGDARESPSMRIAQLLSDLDAELECCDPYLSRNPESATLDLVDLTPDRVAQSDAVVILTDHDSFDYEMVTSHARYIFDTRRRTVGDQVEYL